MSNYTGICNYCGTGCGHLLKVDDAAIRGVFPSPEHPVGKGRLCVRGWHIHELLNSQDRVARPLIRGNGILREAGWDEALAAVAAGLGRFAGPEIGFWASPRASNEDAYGLVRLAHSVFRSPNIGLLSDAGYRAAARVLHEGGAWPAMTGTLADIRSAGFILVVGTDLTRQNPIVASEIHFAARGGTDVIVLSGRTTQMAKLATTHLRPKPGALKTVLAAMSKVLIDENRFDADFIAHHAEGFEDFRAAVSGVRLDDLENTTGLTLEVVRDAARRLAAAPRAMVFFAAGVSGLDRDAAALIFDLFLAAGKIGREGCGVNPVTGISNILGASDMGASPDRPIEDLLQSSPSPLKALVVMDHDEEINLAADRIRDLEFVVYLGSYANPFMDLAHVVLPTASYAETDGTYTNTERRIQLNRRKLEPHFEARPGWRIFSDIAARRGQDWGYRSAGDVFADIARTIPDYAAVTYEKLEKSFGGLQWPCDAVHPQGTPRFRIGEADRLRFVPLNAGYGGPAPAAEYPMSLVAGKSYYYWHQNNIMKKTFIPRREYNALLLLYPRGLVEVHPDDAARLGIRDKRPVRVVSARASMDVAARVTEDVRPGMAYVPYFVGPMVPGFLKAHAALIERGEDAVIPVRIEKV